MPATTRYALPYPTATDPADVPLDLQELAEATETAIITPGAPPFTALTGYTNGWTGTTGAGYMRGGDGLIRMLGLVSTSNVWTPNTAAAMVTAGSIPAGVRPTGGNIVFNRMFQSNDGSWQTDGLILIKPDGGIDFYQFTSAGRAILQLPLNGVIWEAGRAA